MKSRLDSERFSNAKIFVKFVVICIINPRKMYSLANYDRPFLIRTLLDNQKVALESRFSLDTF